jgi:hypothetical protein
VESHIDNGLIRTRRPTRRRPWGISVAAAITALALHLVLLSALSLGASAGRPRSPQGEAAARETPSAIGRTASTPVFIDPNVLADDYGPTAPALEIRLRRLKERPVTRLVLLSAAELGLADDDSSENSIRTATTAADGAERAMLFGRYVNQIAARIERAWVLPRTAPGGTSAWGATAMGGSADARGSESSPLFRCRVQILQSRDGAVLEVTLLECDSSPEWQQSLVNAIDAASPLPAPPSESVFARALVLSFTSAGQIR